MKNRDSTEIVNGQTSLWSTAEEEGQGGPVLEKVDTVEEQEVMDEKLSLKDYDQGIKKLEEIVHKLEHEELTLEENIKLYEEGIKLHKELENILKTQEGKVLEIKEEAAQPVEISFDVE